MTIDTLRHVPLFESLDDEAAKELCKLIETLDCPERQVLFRAGDVGDAGDGPPLLLTAPVQPAASHTDTMVRAMQMRFTGFSPIV